MELDAEANINDHLGIKGGFTFTKAEISDSKDAAVVGNTPRRTPALMFHLLPSYQTKKVLFGIGMIGATDSYTQDNNKLKMPAYVLVNPFIRIALKNNFEVSIESN